MNHRKRKRRPWREEIHHFVCQGGTSVPRRSYRKIPPSGKVWNPYWRRSTRVPRSCSRVPLCWDPRACWKRSPWQQEEPYRTQAHHPCCEEWWGVEQASWRSNYCFRRSSSQHSRSASSQEDWKVKWLLFFLNSSCHAIWFCQTRHATKIYQQDFLKSAHGDKVQTTILSLLSCLCLVTCSLFSSHIPELFQFYLAWWKTKNSSLFHALFSNTSVHPIQLHLFLCFLWHVGVVLLRKDMLFIIDELFDYLLYN